MCVGLGSRWGGAILQLLEVCGMAFSPVPKPLALLAGTTGAHVPRGSTQCYSKTCHTSELILNLDCDRVFGGPLVRLAPGSRSWDALCTSSLGAEV